jgi:hypothetical protein
VNLDLPEVAAEFGAAAERALAQAGGVALARRAEADPSVRITEVAPLLDRLGFGDIRLDDGLDAALAGAELCRVAGRTVLPYPLAAVLVAPAAGTMPVAVVDPARPLVDHGDVFPTWAAVAPDGRTWRAEPAGQALGSRLGPFVVPLTLEPDMLPVAGELPASLALVLGSWQVLGALERAVELTAAHVTERHQFGRPLAAFQAVQFQTADALTAVRGLRELAGYTLWRIYNEPGAAPADALALRVAALDAARTVLGTAQQLHGAIGFCDEHDLSLLVRHTQPLLRLPAGLEATTEALLTTIDRAGFEGLFPLPPADGRRRQLVLRDDQTGH